MRIGSKTLAVFLVALALAAATAEPPSPDYEALAALSPEARLGALTLALTNPACRETAALRLLRGRTFLDLGKAPEAAVDLSDPALAAHPLREFAWKWRADALSADPKAQREREALLRSLFAAPGESSFRLDAARSLSDMLLAASRWHEAIEPLEALLKASPLDAALAASLAAACDRAGETARAKELALWLYTEMPMKAETLDFFRVSPPRLSWVEPLSPERRLRRLLRLDAAGALDLVAAETPLWRPVSALDAAWKPYFAARGQERAGRTALAVRSYLAFKGEDAVGQAALVRTAALLPAAALPKREFEAAVRALETIHDPSAKERAFLALFRWRVRQADASGSSYFALKALARSGGGFEAAEYLYKTSWEQRLSGRRVAADGLLRDLAAGLPPENEYRQAALYSLLLTRGLEADAAASAQQELLSTSRYGYFGYRLREGAQPSPQGQTAPLPTIPPAALGTHRHKALMLASLSLHSEAADELERALGAEAQSWQYWESALQRTRAHEYPDAVTAARKAFPGAFGESGDRIPADAWRVMFPLPYREALIAAATSSGLPGPLIAAVARQESLWDREAVSKAGAVGLLQLLPSTAREVARRGNLGAPDPVKLRDASWNLQAGALYLRAMLDRSGGDLPRALASYNAGPGNVDRWRGRPGNPSDEKLFTESVPFRETRLYIRRIFLNQWEYQRLYADLAEAPPPPSRNSSHN